MGRFAVAQGDAPPLRGPATYILDGENVVFRSEPGRKLTLVSGRVVSFQVDSIDPAGHRVFRCTEPGEPRVTLQRPCGLQRGCPLDAGSTSCFVGVTCALRRDVPLVVAGRTLLHPLERGAIATVDGAVAEVAEDVVQGCERAARPHP